MQRSFLLGASLCALSLPCTAQNEFLGFTTNCTISATTRGTVAANAGEYIVRVDGSEYAGWGTDAAGGRTIKSVYLIIQDQDAVTTAETFDVVLYPENPANPGFPLMTAGVVFATGVTGPAAPATGVLSAAAKTVTPASPVFVPFSNASSTDIFVSFKFSAANWTADGLSVQSILGYAPSTAFTIYDSPGPGQPRPLNTTASANPANTHAYSYVATAATPLSATACRQPYFDLQHSGASGVVMTITNQTTWTPSNNPPPAGYGPAPGTASFMSGVNPDIAGTANAGRADDICFDFYQQSLGTGAPVFFLMDLSASFGPETPISVFAPGSGVACLNTASLAVLGINFTSAGEAWFVTTIPAGVRSGLGGLPVRQQGIALDPTTGALVASPCGGQRF